jgi:glycosyltransferase involved in cell wall biosynthesis
MLKIDTNFFEYIDNFKKNSAIHSTLIKGELSLDLPLITLIIPTFRCEPSILKEAIDSVLNQFEFDNYELLIIDNDPDVNCSTRHLLESYDDNRIIYYKNNENIGMFGNWNRAIELSRSEWIGLIHDDDVTSPYFLKSCLPFLTDKSIGIIKPENFVFSDSKQLHFEKPKDLKFIELSLSDFIRGCAVGAPTNIIFNRKVLLELGGFNQDYFPASDYAFAAKCVKSYKVYKIPFVLGGYRVGQNESLNPKTMKLFYFKRFFISSFIMRLHHFPDFIISLVQTAFMPIIISETNNFYNVNIPFDYCTELKLNAMSEIKRRMIIKLYYVFMKLSLFRKKLTNLF